MFRHNALTAAAKTYRKPLVTLLHLLQSFDSKCTGMCSKADFVYSLVGALGKQHASVNPAALATLSSSFSVPGKPPAAPMALGLWPRIRCNHLSRLPGSF